MKFRVTQYISDYTKVGDEWRLVEIENKYEANNYDDLQQLLMTLINFATGDTKFKISKEVID